MRKTDENRIMRFLRYNKNVVPKLDVAIRLASIVIVILFLVEGCTSVFLDAVDPLGASLDKNFEYHPYLGFVSPFTETTNYCNTTNKNPVNIHLYGGSTMWGDGVRPNETIPSFLSKRLCKKGIAVNVTNFGLPSHQSTQETLNFILRLKEGNIPDIVIFYDGVNDIAAYRYPGYLERDMTRDAFDFYLHDAKLFSNMMNLRYLLIDPENYVEIDEEYEYFDVLGEPSEDEKETYEEVVDIYLDNVELIKRLEKSYDFTAFFYWQPTAATREEPTPEEAESAQSEPYRSSHESVIERIRHEDLVKDLTWVFDDHDGTIFIDDSHVNAEGNKIITRHISGDLMDHLQDSEVNKNEE
ncbi:MAG: hypothetical protein ACLFNK_04585 [Candidatus Woesearchaeota archaeon]